MTNEAIKKRIDELLFENNQIILDGLNVLDGRVEENLEAIEILQGYCHHEFEDGICIYCYKEENE